MGSPKQLLRVGGTTLLERCVKAALLSRLDRVILVLGHEARRIETALGPLARDSKLSIIYNDCYREGISTSLVAGVREISLTHDHAMILLADMPFIHETIIDGLISHYLDCDQPIGAIGDQNRPAHPVIFRRELFEELKSLKGDVGARSLLQKYGDRVCLHKSALHYDGRDVDSPEDLKRVKTDIR